VTFVIESSFESGNVISAAEATAFCRLDVPIVGGSAKNRGDEIMNITDSAREFFDACETGKGWAVCKAWCHDGATFSCQADALAEVTTLEGYTGWMAGLLTPLPDGRYELKAFATDPDSHSVIGFGVFHGTHTGEGGPVAPTGKSVAADYAYVMTFDGDKIRHMTKLWNDVQTLKALGWA
jgi:predicted ester cyclase